MFYNKTFIHIKGMRGANSTCTYLQIFYVDDVLSITIPDLENYQIIPNFDPFTDMDLLTEFEFLP